MLVTQGSYRLIGIVTEMIYFLQHAIVLMENFERGKE